MVLKSDHTGKKQVYNLFQNLIDLVFGTKNKINIIPGQSLTSTGSVDSKQNVIVVVCMFDDSSYPPRDTSTAHLHLCPHRCGHMVLTAWKYLD